MRRRRPEAPPPPKPQSATDPIAPTTTEWREAEREKALARDVWVQRAALVLTLPFVAGGLYAFPLAYAWKGLCARWPWLRRWGVLWALPVVVALRLWPAAVLAPLGQLVGLVGGAGDPAAWTLMLAWWPTLVVGKPLTWPPAIGVQLVSVPLSLGNPLPPLVGVLCAAWPTGVVLACLLVSAWGFGGWLEGTRLRSRTVRDILRTASKATRSAGDAIAEGLLIRGYLTLLYSPEGGGKTEWLLSKMGSTRGRWYLLTEQTDVTLAPYLRRWGLDAPGMAGRIRVVTRDDANRLWRDHGHLTEATWEHLGPMVLDDAGAWGADVFVMDTWTAWTGGTQDAKGIQLAMAPLREAVGRHGYAGLVLAHTNQDGELLGSKEFRRLCDIALRMELPRGRRHPLRVFRYDKDRSGAAPEAFAVVRDLTTTPPSYRSVAVPGAPSVAPVRAVLKEVEPEWAKARALLPATATELAQKTEWPKRTTELRLKRWQTQGRVIYERTAKGRAIPGVWRLKTDTEATA